MKVLNAIKNFLAGLFMVVFFLFAFTMTFLLLNYNEYGLTQFGDKMWVIINDKISSDKYKEGDLVIVEERKIGEGKKAIKVGDEAFAYRLGPDEEAYIEVGVVGKIYEKDNDIAYENGSTFGMKFVLGSPVKVYENVGKFLSVVESKWGFLFIVLVPCFLIFIYEIYALIVEIKYGKEEE